MLYALPLFEEKYSCFFNDLLSFLPQTSRPEAFPHPHRLPAESNRLGTNRPCSQVSAAPPARGCSSWALVQHENQQGHHLHLVLDLHEV